MVFRRKTSKRTVRRSSKKSFVKKAVTRAKTNRLVKLIKKVALKPCETKQQFTLLENNQLYHNTPTVITDLLYTKQGITDTQSGTSQYNNRIGDSVVARGISLKFWLANKLDRPNVMYRIVIFKYKAGVVPAATDIYLNASGNYMIKDYNTEKISILYSKIVNLQVGFSATATVSGANYNTQKEAHKLIKVWIPMKNKMLKYDGDNSGVPKWFDIGFSIVPYDSYGTLTTDNIASFAVHSKFYFKDP